MADIKKIKKLRGDTGISMMECKEALEEADGEVKKAKKILREKGKEKLKEKEASGGGGIVASYIHPGNQVGVLLKLRCESSFGAKSDEFKELAHEICLHIAAAEPLFVKPEDIDEEFLDGEKKIYKKQFEDSGKPDDVIKQIIEGKLEKYKKESSLLTQEWIKEDDKTIQDLIDSYIQRIGETIYVEKFERYEI